MKSNIYSIKPVRVAKVLLALLLIVSILASCRSTTPALTATAAPSVTATLEPSQTPSKENESGILQGETETIPTFEGEVPIEDTFAEDLENIPPELQTEIAVQETLDADPFAVPNEGEGVLPDDEETLGSFEDEFGSEFSEEPPADLLATPEATPTPRRWPTPSSLPLGDPSNPLIIGVVIASEGDLPKIDAVQEMALQIGDLTGYTLDVAVVRSYSELLNGLRARAIHIAFLQPFTYIFAKEKGYAAVGLLSNHFGVIAYGTQFIANASNPDMVFYHDENTNESISGSEEALIQLDGKRGCYVDPLSASGYVAAAGLLARNQVETLPPAFLQSHGAVVRAVYVPGICDFGVTYALTGDPRTGNAILTDFPDLLEQVKIIWRSDGIIPNLNISYQSRVPDDVRENLTKAFIDLAAAEEGQFLLSNANGYEITGLEETTDSFYDPLRSLLSASKVDLLTLVGK